MEEEQRRVRAHSDHTGRPYFSINYKLSLSAKDLLALALEEMEVIDTDFGEPTPLPPPPPHPASSVSQRRNSGFDNSDSWLKIVELNERAPGTPTSQYRKRTNGTGGSTVTHIPLSSDQNSSKTSKKNTQNSATDKTVRRIKSASTMAEIELNRTAPANPAAFQTGISENKVTVQTQNMLPGFVTCLNSRNVAKYNVGQRYRDGVVVGIDDDHGKIIVYNENLPRGALTVLKTRDAARYDKGFVLEDVRGQFLGTVHAVDRVQNLLVLNTTPSSGTDFSGSVNSAPPPPTMIFSGGVTVN